MERIEFMACDEKLGDFGQFMVVEETIITQGESSEDPPNLVITWGKLKLKLTEPRTSPIKDYNNRHVENKTNKRVCSDDELTNSTQLAEMSGNTNGVVTDDAVKNKEINSEIISNTEKNVPISAITDSNNMTNSTNVNIKNRINRKKCENTKNAYKTIGSNPLNIIDENYCTGDEASDEGWTNIPKIKTQNNSNKKRSSVVIQELDNCDDLKIEVRRFGDKSPLIEEIGEDDDENANHAIIDSRTVIEELNDLSEHEEVSTSCVIQDKSEKEDSKANPDSWQTIHLSFQRVLDYHEECVEEYFPECFKMGKFKPISVQDEKKSLFSFRDLIGQSKVVVLEKPEEKVNSGSNDKPQPDSFEHMFEDFNTKTNEDELCCKREATPDIRGTTSRQEIYLFLFLVFFIFLLIFHISTSSSQEYSCYGGNGEDETSSCALDGYVELSRI